MEKKVLGWQIKAFGLSALGGTLLHFLYDWTGGSILTAPFSGVNESTWEHMKLLFWPLLILARVQQKDFKEFQNLKKEQGITDEEFYHYDTPLTVKHETEALLEAGFSSVEVLNSWGATYTLKAFC